MTHPDPYIEEVIIKLDELLERASCACDGRLPHGVHYVLADVNHGKDGEEIRDLLRTALEAQKKAFGGCTFCYGKGYSTQIENWTGRGYSKAAPYYLPCDKCDRGQQIETLMESATKTQRIKDIEEIEAALPTNIHIITGSNGMCECGTREGSCGQIIHNILTSRKAAIEEQ